MLSSLERRPRIPPSSASGIIFVCCSPRCARTQRIYKSLAHHLTRLSIS